MIDTLATLIHDIEALGQVTKSTVRITVILTVAWFAMHVGQRAIRAIRLRIAERLDEAAAKARAETIGRVLRYLLVVVVTVIAVLLVLTELGISVAPLLGAAGVAGLAIGFGAQSLVKDYFTGVFLLLEDQVRVGDWIELDRHAGQVEEMTLRYIRLRDYEGRVHYVPNGTVSSVINLNRGFGQAVIEVGIDYASDVDRAMGVMRQTAAEMRADPAWSAHILDDIEMAGVERLDESAVTLRARIKVATMQHAPVRREYLRRVKRSLDASGIGIPFPQRTLHIVSGDGAERLKPRTGGRTGTDQAT
jgi:small conductance mechanosensitive channel